MSKVTVVPPIGGGGGGDIPSGVIVMWSGAANAIPNGWALCNGSNGTPDLRGRFVVGAGDTYSVGDTGGAASVTLTVSQIPKHSHQIATMDEGNSNFGIVSRSQNNGLDTYTTKETGGGQAHENRPPYCARRGAAPP